MTVRPIYDRHAFEAKIAEATAASAPPLRVLRTMSLQPVPEGAVLAQRPALVITYTQPLGDEIYRYQEICLADEHGVIQLDQAPLWQKIHARLERESASGGRAWSFSIAVDRCSSAAPQRSVTKTTAP